MSNEAANPNTAIVKTPAEKIRDLQAFLEKRTDNLKQIAAKHVTPERLIKIVVTAASRTPKLLECSPSSVYLALMQAADLGLEPNTPLQLAALVPFKNKHTARIEAQFQPMYKGLLRLALQSGEVVSITPRVVYENDEFELVYGLEEKINHKPSLKNPGVSVGFYVVVTMKDGTKTFDFMTRAKIDTYKAKSQASGEGPWVTDYDEMAIKTVIKHACKYLALSSEKFARAVNHDTRAEVGEGPDYSDVIDISGETVVDPTPAPLAIDAKPAIPEVPTLKAAEKARADVAAKAAAIPASPVNA